jgi:hypothetical protein
MPIARQDFQLKASNLSPAKLTFWSSASFALGEKTRLAFNWLGETIASLFF